MSPRSSLIVASLLLLGGLWACACDTAMIWDGAYQFCLTLIHQEPYKYLSRFHSWIVWWPTVWASGWTDHLGTLRFIYGLPFCLAPFAGAALSWWVVKRSAPGLALWALFGTAIAPLPGQIFMINDSIFQQHMFWPVFLATFLPLTWAQRIVMALLSVFQLSHPIGIGLCGGTAMAAIFFAVVRGGEMRRPLLLRAGGHLALAAGGVWKLFHWPDSYAAQEATLKRAVEAFSGGVLGWQLAGLIAMWCAGWVILRRPAETAEAEKRKADRLVAGLVCAGGAMWLFWAVDVHSWPQAINFRRWVVPMTAPFFAAALWEIWRPPAEPASGLQDRGRIAILLAAVYAVVLGAQAAGWAGLARCLENQVATHDGARLSRAELRWTRGTALDHWGTVAQVVVSQGKKPRTLLLTGEGLARMRSEPSAVILAEFDHVTPREFTVVSPEPNARGWFQWGEVFHQLRAAKSPILPDAAGEK